MSNISDNECETYPDYQLLLFGPFTTFLEICIQIYSVVFALSRQINTQKVCENN